MKIEQRIERLFKLAELFLPAFLEANKAELDGRTGIALLITSNIDPNLEAVPRNIGGLSIDRFTDKCKFVREKITRMYNNNEWCSFQSENEDQASYGGGIKASFVYIIPSGFPPHLDQKFALELAFIAEEISASEITFINTLSYSKIEYWRYKSKK